MSSRKEEERNEKIIRGLMKLPPNRRCINCNHMGPQYVCTNFWTFVCITCSGIHREFTHRVKSVSMATFTSEEVEALQKGGNQCAREIYLKQWDSQSQRLPDNSNADKVREFIRNVYVNKKYLGGSSDRPPRDLQNGRSRDEEIRRASSYHSYSQSPPNDFQYEERRYGKPAPVLTRKPGSDRGLYDGKVSSFLSPGRLSDRSPSGLSDRTNEDSCGGERFGSPLSETSRDFSGEDIVQTTENSKTKSPARRSFGQMLHPERTASLGSSGSLDSPSFGSASHEHEGPVAVHQDTKSTVPSLPQQSFPGSFDGLDLFSAPYAPATVSSSSANVPQLPGSSSTRLIDLLENSSTSNAPTFSSSQQLQPTLFPSLDMFHPEPSAATSDKPLQFIPQNEGWATFDSPQPVVPLGTAKFVGKEKSASDANSVGDSDENLLYGQLPSVQNNSAHEPSPVMPPFWNDNMQNVETLPSTSSSESWSAFEDSCSNLWKNQDQVPVHQSSFANHYLPTESEIGHSHESGNKSMNPFDLPYDGENMSQFFGMDSLQAALPNVQAPSPFISGANEHWFVQDTTAPYVDVNSDGGFGYIAGHAQTAQISTVSSHGSVASVGGNPFA